MSMRALIRCLVLVAAAAAAVPAPAAEPAGEVTRFKGAAIATAGGDSRALRAGSQVFVGDKISTAAATRLEMRMLDGAVITLGDHTFIEVDEFLYDPGAKGNAAFDIIQGVFNAVSGGIGKVAGGRMTITTPVATIGIRGTTFWGRQHIGRVEVALLDGTGVFVETPTGRVELTEVGTGTMVEAPGRAPTPPKPWGEARLDAARRTVAFE